MLTHEELEDLATLTDREVLNLAEDDPNGGNDMDKLCGAAPKLALACLAARDFAVKPLRELDLPGLLEVIDAALDAAGIEVPRG